MLISDVQFAVKIPPHIRSEKLWVIGLSGGADSLCLTLLANEYAQSNEIRIFACIVDHNLRAESSTEIIPIANILEDRKIPYEIVQWEHPKNIGGNIELKARLARYNLLYHVCKKLKCNVLMTAHHALDQWETFFMRLSKGSSIKGLSCIKSLTTLNDIKLVRPILDFSPDDIKKTLTERFNISNWVMDPSNKDPRFERTKWRMAYPELLKKYNLSIENVCKAINRLQNTNDCLDDIAEDLILQIFDGIYLDLAKFKKLHAELKLRVLEKVVLIVSPKGKHIVSYDLLKRTSGSLCNIDFSATNLSGVILRKDKTKNIRVYQEKRTS
ncbi:MAG: tRNA lysidine(34) synthetase TilS [Holosporales bacterium]|jgi:tRNA(Ile)-lysidine synthase|nr:tRNA lysidine(34) synthetase TilS [Holosporales bacterium]